MPDPDNTGPKLTQFQSGAQWRGNAAGRPKGSRNQLGEDFIKALQEDFHEHGADAVKTVREEKPDQYLKVIASLMPKDVNLTINDAEDLTDDDIRERIRDLTNQLAPFLGGAGSPGDDAPKAGSPTKPPQIH
jgi:hypothetical protein